MKPRQYYRYKGGGDKLIMTNDLSLLHWLGVKRCAVYITSQCRSGNLAR